MRDPKDIFPNLAEPPRATKRPVTLEHHGESRDDPYHWMRDENWQEVLQDPSLLNDEIRAHLDAENAYYENSTAELAPLRAQLFSEMRGRIKEDDSSVPELDGDYAYGVRFVEGGQYPIYYRTSRQGDEEIVLLDGDKEGAGEAFFDIGGVNHSPDHELIAYGIDRLGSEYYDIRIREIQSGKEYSETIPKTDGSAVWDAQSRSFYYVERDDHQRPKRVKRHYVGEPSDQDELIYEEEDDGFFLSVGKSQSGDFIIITSSNGSSSEEQFLRSDAPEGASPELIAPRREDELYFTDHAGEHFYISTNTDGAVDFKIVKTSINAPGRENWQDWLSHKPGHFMSSFVPYRDFLVRLMRIDALPHVIISDYERKEETTIDFQEAAYALGLEPGLEAAPDHIRFSYASPSTPTQTFDYKVANAERILRKTQVIPSGHNADLYAVERLNIPASDGAEIPVTILRLKSVPIDGSAPLLLYGYGAYGITIPASFSSSILPVVDRGVVYAIAHIRGGAARGRQWYLDGKLDKKPNSFTDFATVAAALQAKGYGKTGQTVIYGGSAGGLLVGATLNLRPALFGGAIGAVPFVDVLNTICDASLPLTPPEWVEWGDPITDKSAFETIKSYSPYDNIRPNPEYPPVLATGGLTDYRVTYWEPAKWVARLRDENDGGPFFLKMNMEAGHGGSAARFERLKEKAHDYAFALALFDIVDAQPVSHDE